MKDFDQIMARVFAATETRTQVELAEFLGIRQSSISDAKRRQAIPDSWLMTILRKRAVNPDWIMTGTGGQFMAPCSDREGHAPDFAEVVEAAAAKARQDLLEKTDMNAFVALLRDKLPPDAIISITYGARPVAG